MEDHMDYLARRIGYPNYSAHLRGEHWKIFVSDTKKDRCYCCGRADAPLQVHHITYDRLGKEWPCDVATVCDGCHVAIHRHASGDRPLEKAHFAIRRQIEKRRDRQTRERKPTRNERLGRDKWVELRDLVNRSARQTTDELREFLVSKGLLDLDGAPTLRAYEMGERRSETVTRTTTHVGTRMAAPRAQIHQGGRQDLAVLDEASRRWRRLTD